VYDCRLVAVTENGDVDHYLFLLSNTHSFLHSLLPLPGIVYDCRLVAVTENGDESAAAGDADFADADADTNVDIDGSDNDNGGAANGRGSSGGNGSGSTVPFVYFLPVGAPSVELVVSLSDGVVSVAFSPLTGAATGGADADSLRYEVVATRTDLDGDGDGDGDGDDNGGDDNGGTGGSGGGGGGSGTTTISVTISGGGGGASTTTVIQPGAAANPNQLVSAAFQSSPIRVAAADGLVVAATYTVSLAAND
jgi:hypothetical protein